MSNSDDTIFAILPPVPVSPNRPNAGAHSNDREEVWAKSQLTEPFRGWIPTSPREQTDLGNTSLQTTPLSLPYHSQIRAMPKRIRPGLLKAGPKAGNCFQKNKKWSFHGLHKTVKNPGFFTHCARFSRSRSGLLKARFKEKRRGCIERN